LPFISRDETVAPSIAKKADRNQAVRIPRDFELPGDDAIMRKARPDHHISAQVEVPHQFL
jgi:hypothetical protein